LQEEQETTIEGFVEKIIFRNSDNGYTVLSLHRKSGDVTCVGETFDLDEGEYIEAAGQWTVHPVYDRQFKISAYQVKIPEDLTSVRRYLGSGAIKGIGEKMAARIVKKFGQDTLHVLEEEPERLAEVKGISYDGAMKISAQVVEKRQMRDVMMALTQYGIGMKLATDVYSRYGDDTLAVLQKNPYRLAEDVAGIGFGTADEIARKTGVELTSDFRIRAGILFTLQAASGEGNVYLPADVLQRRSGALLQLDLPDFDNTLEELSIEGKIILKKSEDGTGQEVRVYLPALFRAESETAGYLTALNEFHEDVSEEAEIRNGIRRITQKLNVEPDETQEDAAFTALTNPVVVITGGPGTGKTTIIRTIISYFEWQDLDVALAAPTGRAARRMSEATGRPAQTIHRLLGASGGPAAQEKDTAGASHVTFAVDRDNPLDADVLIIDESSMVDIFLMRSLLTALSPGTRLILVGDVDQLPSVGPGNVLRDIIDSGIFPVVKLTKIFRQAAESDIVMNAHRINNGEPVTLTTHSRDFLYLKRDTPQQIIGAIYTLVTDKLPKYVNGNASDIQILTPSRKTALGVETLNRIMQEMINPAAPEKPERKVGSVTFRLGDKVMQTKNNYTKEWTRRSVSGTADETGVGVYNGDTGVIRAFSDVFNTLTVAFDDGREAVYPFEELEELDLAYAMTIHKAQGSEYKAVVMPLFPGPPMLMNRNLLYTAVTRAKKCVVLVGHADVFEQMERSLQASRRYSSLAGQIREVAGL
jgi:exodeoxyribonuclease V alpha subunit